MILHNAISQRDLNASVAGRASISLGLLLVKKFTTFWSSFCRPEDRLCVGGPGAALMGGGNVTPFLCSDPSNVYKMLIKKKKIIRIKIKMIMLTV